MAGEGVAAQHGQRVVRAGAHDRDPSGPGQRQRAVPVGHQDAGAFGQQPGQRAVARRVEVHGAAGPFGVHPVEGGRQSGVPRVQEAESALLQQDAAQGAVDQFLGDGPLAHGGHQRVAVAAHGRQFDVDAGGQGEAGGVAPVGGDLVQGLQEADAEVVGDHRPGEPPGVAQESGEQRRVGGDGDAVDLGVAVHHGAYAALAHRHLERRQDDVGHLTRARPDRRVVAGAGRGGVAREVLERGHDPGGLQALDVGGGDGADQVRVLADGLLHPAPAKVADHVQDGGEPLVDPDRPHVLADPPGHLGDQLGVPGGAPGERDGVGGGAPGGESGQALLMGERRDPEPAGLGDPGLGAGQREGADPRVHRGGAERPGELAQSAGGDLLEVDRVDHLVLVRRYSVALGVGAHPDAVQLGGLLLEGHPGRQIGHPLLGAQRRVAPRAVGGGELLGLSGGRDGVDCHGGRGSSHECGGAGRQGCATCRPPPSVR